MRLAARTVVSKHYCLHHEDTDVETTQSRQWFQNISIFTLRGISQFEYLTCKWVETSNSKCIPLCVWFCCSFLLGVETIRHRWPETTRLDKLQVRLDPSLTRRRCSALANTLGTVNRSLVEGCVSLEVWCVCCCEKSPWVQPTNRKLTDDPLVNLLGMAFHGLILLIGDEMPEQIAFYF